MFCVLKCNKIERDIVVVLDYFLRNKLVKESFEFILCGTKQIKMGTGIRTFLTAEIKSTNMTLLNLLGL